ncbi:ASCH domain-containing protein [Prauserella muralis]|uniref:ASCH domain-containing protein n=1 Tax=Prauserella muralis TaxID=588067 RepID=A0A2V4BK98_9PSEU|nr:ASCH domain-containing protein [Prauserella muralis]PXY31113.1 hypothetical protein BAY60_01485 [Prauserella muralis]TWE14596.1 ASCH domain-containing protein [Prauserella muralis]
MTTHTATRAVEGRRALSIRQPWAALILAGHKPVENRTWGTRWRGVLLLHAGQRPDPHATTLAARYGITSPPTGAYLGTAVLADVHHDRDCGGCTAWSEPGVWHWVLTHPRAFAEPIRAPGQRGLYTPPTAITTHATVRAVEEVA